MRLTDTIQKINMALNYPALVYEDISVYFDMAIAELNTTLHINMPTVSDMVKDFRQLMSKTLSNQVVLTVDPQQNDFAIDIDPIAPAGGNPKCYYDSNAKVFNIWDNFKKEYVEYSTIIGIYIREGNPEKYISAIYGTDVYWVAMNETEDDCDLSDYLTDDWVLLWLIPYVCFKYSVRDGGSAQTFAEELTQGFQQLQESYDVPDKVVLATYADRPAYTKLAEKYIDNLGMEVRTRAIYQGMKHARDINAIYGNMYDRGGFGDD